MFRVLLWTLLILVASAANGENNRTFPDGFLFGVATAAYQTEGGWEADGKGENIWDHLVHTKPSAIENNDNGDVACDSYHKFKEDVTLAADLGVKHYRFSISWSRLLQQTLILMGIQGADRAQLLERILPNGFANVLNMKGINYYQDLISEILSKNMIPVVTLYHWDLPQPLQDIGGWTNPEIVKHFETYARVVIENLNGVCYWVTFNEPKQVCVAGYGMGLLAPGINLDGTGDYLCTYVILKAHAAVYHMYKKEFPHLTAKMSIVIDGQWSEPATNSTADTQAAERRRQFEYGLFANPIFNGDWPEIVKDRIKFRSEKENFATSRLPEFTQEEIEYIKGTYDYLGFNTYFTLLGADMPESEYGDPSYYKDMRVSVSVDPSWKTGSNGNSIVPWGARKYLKWLKETYNNPEIFITENGLADNGTSLDDDDRIGYYAGYLSAILDAIYEDEVRVIAFTAWSLLDNFEWIQGYTQHFGLYHVDFTNPNRTRTAKKSVDFYRTVSTTLKIPVVSDTTTDDTTSTTTIHTSTTTAINTTTGINTTTAFNTTTGINTTTAFNTTTAISPITSIATNFSRKSETSPNATDCTSTTLSETIEHSDASKVTSCISLSLIIICLLHSYM